MPEMPGYVNYDPLLRDIQQWIEALRGARADVDAAQQVGAVRCYARRAAEGRGAEGVPGGRAVLRSRLACLPTPPAPRLPRPWRRLPARRPLMRLLSWWRRTGATKKPCTA